MWKRLHPNKGSRQLDDTGSPSLIESPPGESAQSEGQSDPEQIYRPMAERPTRPNAAELKRLPPLPFGPATDIASSPVPRKGVHRRPASSLYSQSSPNPKYAQGPREDQYRIANTYSEQIEISPPSSPDTFAGFKTRSRAHQDISARRDVSPVEGARVESSSRQALPKTNSGIPVLKKDERNQVAPSAASSRVRRDLAPRDMYGKTQHRDTRWDAITGEPTSDTYGRPTQVRPVSFASATSYARGGFGVQTLVTAHPNGKPQPSFGERVRKLRDVNIAKADRPELKGSSDRAMIVSPAPPSLDSPSRNPITENGIPYDDSVTTSSLSMRPILSQVRESTYTTPDTAPGGRVGIPLSTSTIERDFREALNEIRLPATNRDQLPSRFSVTTYATSSDGSPRQSIDSTPPVPSVIPPPSPILNRRRPKTRSIDSSKATTRKAVAGDAIIINLQSSSGPDHLSNPSKSLPKSPAEAASVDRIGSLQAQLDDLRRRRANLQESIHRMTELMPRVAQRGGAEAQRREDEKQKVEALRRDLADVGRQEHELGLTLHRAWKREAHEAAYEPSSLWVRRVTT
ncbi:MAG: hypothetical protein M1818_005505 [Claussenomyces sp. TS43310]|nr:MAG: hypothetical protein M1818_005505 [Claussenomyces sp. TS43310]